MDTKQSKAFLLFYSKYGLLSVSKVRQPKCKMLSEYEVSSHSHTEGSLIQSSAISTIGGGLPEWPLASGRRLGRQVYQAGEENNNTLKCHLNDFEQFNKQAKGGKVSQMVPALLLLQFL